MVTLRIEHVVPDFAAWKRAFDSDPLNRRQSGVRSYRSLRPIDNPLYVTMDLDFDDRPAADSFLIRLRELWRNVNVMREPKAQILEIVDAR